MPGLHIVRNIPEYAWIIPEYAWIRRNMREYAYICLNFFVLHFPIVLLCLFERMVTYFKVYAKLEDIVWRNMKVFFEETKFHFFIKAGSICFVFCFRLNSLISKTSNFVLHFGGRESCYTLTGFWSASSVH